MEETDQESRTASPDIPRLPIKTYHWEDVRRSRKRGAYPWTHLTKPPYDEEADPEEYTMDAFRRSRSSSTVGKSDMQEITDIEEEFEFDSKIRESNPELEEKENIPAEQVEPKNLDRITINPNNKDRAKSEEPTKKRKLSVDSSYSRISLPKLRLMEKLKNAKDKFKVPKLTKRPRPHELHSKEIKKEKPATSTTRKDKAQAPLNNNSPVYIHIPLKPPPGETDEFSKYEFESPSHSPVGSKTNINEIPEKKRKTSLLEILTQIKQVHDQHVARRSSQSTDEFKQTIPLKPDSTKDDEGVCIQEITTDQPLTKDEGQPIIEIEESGSTSHTDLQHSTESDKLTIEEIINEEPKPKTPELLTKDIDNSSVDDNISEYLDKDDRYEVIPETKKPISEQAQSSTTKQESDFKPDPEKLRKLEGALSKWKKQVPKTTSNLDLPLKETQPIRARSEEPKRKRKSSIDSSYSRKSLSRLTFLKKLKQAREKIKLPKFPSFSKFDKKDSTKTKEKKIAVPKPIEVSKHLKPTQPDKPVYIHIPLKPPPGQTDEFSYLANEPVTEIVPEEDKSDDKSLEELETPEPDSENNVQLIILTPPSDDEILDGPDTPLESDQKFFESLKIEDLKTLAKNAVNTVYPEHTKLETVEEDERSDTQESSEEDRNEEPPTTVQKHQILVDEEDGLKLSDVAIAMINEELEKEYRQQAMSLKSIIKSETSPVLKKKVSFKRRSRHEGGDRIYEDVQLRKDESKTGTEENIVAHSVVIPLESFQSMSVDEEKSYLDKQMIKTTSLEDDYNKWSKLNDHEYEPIDPPPEVITIRNPPIIHDNALPSEQKIQTSFKEERLNSEKEENANSVQEMQKNLEDRFFRQATESPKPIAKGSSTLQKPSLKTESEKAKTKARTGKSFNETIKTHADKIKSKIQSIKRPNITLPQRPKFPTAKMRKPNFKKPNFKMPKLPDRPTISLPSFNFTRKSSKDAWRERQFSTESNAGDSKKKIFDFRTYPRMFDKSKKKEQESSMLPPEFATVPRTSKSKTERPRWPISQESINKQQASPKVIRIPLHPDEEEKQDRLSIDLHQEIAAKPENEIEVENKHVTEAEDENEFEYKQEDNDESLFSKDFLKRWEHGQFHAETNIPEHRQEPYIDEYRDEELENVPINVDDSFDITPPKEHSSESLNEHRRGVLEEIDSDEFFLREKGISQEDIEVGKYLSSEIREAFRNPVAQFQSEDREYDMELSDQSEPIREPPRRKPLRKPKRKKTPHVSREQISFDRESYNSEPEEYPKTFDEPIETTPPVRPKRRNTKKRKEINQMADVIPFQETIPIDDQDDIFIHSDYTPDMVESSEILPGNILSSDIQYHYENEFPRLYENEHMRGIEQPEITVSHTYYRFEHYPEDHPPIPPTRRHRSLRSLSVSDQDSMLEEDKISRDLPEKHVSAYLAEHEYIIPTPEPPIRPRRTRSRTRSQSVLQQPESDGISQGTPEEETSFIIDSVMPVEQIEVVEIIEPPCVKDIRDASGYAIIDKTKVRDPPLPPSRFDDIPKTPPRRRRSRKNDESDRFATVPRLSTDNDPPRRPLRNYSTLRGTTNLLTDEEKENLNLAAEHLQSGEVIQKMKDRPLPAPPRPPRKSRSVLNDVSHKQNMMTDSQENLNKLEAGILLDIEDQIVSYDHEETITHGALILQTIVDPNTLPYTEVLKTKTDENTIEHIIPITQELDEKIELQHDEHIEEIHTPYEKFSEDEDFSLIPDEFAQLKSPEEAVIIGETINVTPEEPLETKNLSEIIVESVKDSEVPEEFHKLKDYPSAILDEEKVNQNQNVQDGINLTTEHKNFIMDDQEINVLTAQKLQVCDLDVDKLRVRELQAGKIIVTELDGVSLQVSEINSKCGNLVLSGIDLPPNLIQEMLHKLQIAASEQASREVVAKLPEVETAEDATVNTGQKKTSIEEIEEAPPVPPRYDSRTNLVDEEIEPLHSTETQNLVLEELLQPPIRPPRRSSQVEKLSVNIEQLTEPESATNAEEVHNDSTKESEPEIVLKKTSKIFQCDDVIDQKSEEEPPPRPPEPILIDDLEVEPVQTFSKSDDEPPPRPPEPIVDELNYIPSQPPISFYALKSTHLKEFFDEDIPLPPRRKRHHRPPPVSVSRSSSDDLTPAPRRHHRPPEQSIPQLTGQLVRLCAVESERSIKRLISHITNNVLQNADGKQDLHVIILLLIILIAGLLLLSEPKVTIHQNHWDFFNPPTDS
ncbi:hypothetical protein RN001_009652 [Aquatica leii]|uniref:Uncharacterized protein n=1 Tax=Aquatica leii TaxID=1421715 RepID=A0AAN7P914_9COLE|nr:hypothetical protein RN001_009652 [Aquatica leii]